MDDYCKTFLALLTLIVSLHAADAVCATSAPLGMISGDIEDHQIMASSVYHGHWEPGCQVQHARLYRDNGLAWCALHKSTSEWLKVDLGVPATVSAILVQGRGDGREWVTSFQISYSLDDDIWDNVNDDNNVHRVFQANKDSYSVEHVYLSSPIEARLIKIHVRDWNRHPSMRLEFVGCQEARQSLGQPPYGSYMASSSYPHEEGSSCRPQDAELLSSKAWCAANRDRDSWIQMDIGPPALVTAIVTKGRADTGRKQWVTKYRVSYSNDSHNWTFYHNDQSLLTEKVELESGIYKELPSTVAADGVVEFGGNIDKNTKRTNYLSKPFVARYIRLHPLQWNRGISLRFGLLGKQHSGECMAGFTKPNSASPCVENIAFGKETWLYMGRHNKRALSKQEDQTLQLGQRAVDGRMENNLDSCIVIHTLYDEEPQLTIDLGAMRDVSGFHIYLWDALSKDVETSYGVNQYAITLESLAVYVSSNKNGESLCGRIHNRDYQFATNLVQKLLCGSKVRGRYVRIIPEGRPVDVLGSNWYGAVICEVTAFT